MMRSHPPTNRSPEPPWAHRRAPPAWLSLALIAAVPVAVYLLTHPLAGALAVGLAVGRLSDAFTARLRTQATWLRLRLQWTLTRPPLRLAAAVRSGE